MSRHVEEGGVAQQRGHQRWRLGKGLHCRDGGQGEGLHGNQQHVGIAEHCGHAAPQPHAAQEDSLQLDAADRLAGFDDGGEHWAILVLAGRVSGSMRNRRLYGAKRKPVRHGLRNIGKAQFHDAGTQRAKGLDGIGQHGRCRGVHAIAVPCSVDADAQAPHALVHRCEIVRHRIERCGGVLRIGARNHAEQHPGIDRTARHRSDVVHRRRECENALAAHTAPTRLQPGQAVGRAWKADRASGVGSQRPVAKAGRRRHARAAGRHARPVVRMPRVARRFDGGMVIGVGALGELKLAQQHCPGLLQAAHHDRVFFRNAVSVDGHAARGGETCGVAQVFHRHGNAVQRPTIEAGLDLRFRRLGLRHGGIRHYQRVALKRAVQRGDAVELGACRSHRRDLTGADARSQFGQVEVMKGRVPPGVRGFRISKLR